jgi:hypothetical protein
MSQNEERNLDPTDHTIYTHTPTLTKHTKRKIVVVDESAQDKKAAAANAFRHEMNRFIKQQKLNVRRCMSIVQLIQAVPRVWTDIFGGEDEIEEVVRELKLKGQQEKEFTSDMIRWVGGFQSGLKIEEMRTIVNSMSVCVENNSLEVIEDDDDDDDEETRISDSSSNLQYDDDDDEQNVIEAQRAEINRLHLKMKELEFQLQRTKQNIVALKKAPQAFATPRNEVSVGELHQLTDFCPFNNDNAPEIGELNCLDRIYI